MNERIDLPSTAERNRRIYIHEAETPMDGHDEDGRCCLRAQLTPTHVTPAATRPDTPTNGA